MAQYVSYHRPHTVAEAIKLAEKIDLFIWSSQKNRLIGDYDDKKHKSQN